MFDSLQTIIASLGGFLFSVWWLWLPLILFLLLKDLWLKNTREKFIREMKWVLLEVKSPRELKKDPRAMEQALTGLHGFQRTPNFQERNFLGHLQEWFSLELASLGGEIHFFIRTLEQFRNQVEAQIYAQYPEAEIFEADDYTQFVPSDILNKDYDLWGTDLVLIKDDAYPIRTYPAFRKDIIDLEEMVDPVASLSEVMSKLEPGEQIWVQTLIRPILEKKWEARAEKVKNKLVGRKIGKTPGLIKGEAIGFGEAAREVFEQAMTGLPAAEKKPDKPAAPAPMMLLTQAERDVIQAIENKADKVYFETIIRFIYLGRQDVFNKANVSAIFGCYKQFNIQNLNGFKPNKKLMTRINYKIQLKGPREFYRKKQILAAYKKRYFPSYSPVISHYGPLFFERLPILNRFFLKARPFVLNIEELATVYHYPAEVVKAPTLLRVEAKKGGPPPGLPVG